MDANVPHIDEFDRQLLIRLRENLIDLDTRVDDCRADYEHAKQAFDDAVAARFWAARELSDLLKRLPAPTAA